MEALQASGVLRHGRRLNGKTKVTNIVEVKEEADPDGGTQELTPAEMEAIWLQVKREIKEEMDSENLPSSVSGAMDTGDFVKKETASEVKIKQELVDGVTPRRRGLSGRVQHSAGLLDPVAIKKEVKQEADDHDCKQELTAEEMEAMWLEIKQEIKEEMEAEATGICEGEHVSRASVKREIAGEVKVKRELLEEENQDRVFHDSHCTQPADPATPKRRRLTRRDLETPAKQPMEIIPRKQQACNQAEVKQEVKTETHGPLKVKQELHDEKTKDPSLLNTSVGIKKEVIGLAAQSSTLKVITVKKEPLEDDMTMQAKEHPSLLAVKEEERVGLCRLPGSFFLMSKVLAAESSWSHVQSKCALSRALAVCITSPTC